MSTAGPNFSNLILSLPRESNYQNPPAGQQRGVEQHAGDVASTTRPALPEVRSGGGRVVADRIRSNTFHDTDRSQFDSWLQGYIQREGSDAAGIQNHRNAASLNYLISFDSIQTGASTQVEPRLRALNEEMSRFLNNIERATELTVERRSSHIFDGIIQHIIGINSALLNSPMLENEQVRTQLNALNLSMRRAYQLLGQIIPENHPSLTYLREFSLAQQDIMSLHFREANAAALSPAEQIRLSRSAATHLRNCSNVMGNTDLTGPGLAYTRTRTPIQLNALSNTPSEEQLARSLITQNSLWMLTTIAQEIDVSHREDENTARSRYFRMSQVLEGMLSHNPQLNLTQVMNELRNLRYDARVYRALTTANPPIDIQAAANAFSNSSGDTALRTRVRQLINIPGWTQYNDQDLVQILRGSATLHQILPYLANHLIDYIQSAPANDPNRAWISRYFALRDHESQVTRLNQAAIRNIIAQGFQNHTTPTRAVRDLILESGPAGRNTVQSFIRELQQQDEALRHQHESNHETHTPLQIPAWLTELSNGNFRSPANHQVQNTVQNLTMVRNRLLSGESLNSDGQYVTDDHDDPIPQSRRDLTYASLINFITEARDRDLPHFNGLLEDRSVMDEDQVVMNQLMQLDRSEIQASAIGWNDRSSSPQARDYVDHWARAVLGRVHSHSFNFSEAFIHDNETHPASYHLIGQFLGSNRPGNINQQLQSLTGQSLRSTTVSDLATRSREIDGRLNSIVRRVGSGFASWENLAMTGLMIGATQMINRTITGTEMVASGTRIGLSEVPYLGRPIRWMVNNPVSTSMVLSGMSGAGYAFGNHEIQRREGRESDLSQDFLRGAAPVAVLTAPLWLPAWAGRVRSLPQTLELAAARNAQQAEIITANSLAGARWYRFAAGSERYLATAIRHPELGALAGGTLYAGVRSISNEQRDLPHFARNLMWGTLTTLGFLSPNLINNIDLVRAGTSQRIATRAFQANQSLSRLGIFAEGGQLGFAGHAVSSTGVGLITTGLGAGLQYGRDSGGGYQTHFGHDLAMGTLTLGTGLFATSVLGAFVNQSITRRFGTNLQSAIEAGETINLSQSTGREAWSMTWRTLISASVATGGMLLGSTEARALSNGRFLPNRSDLPNGEEAALTAVNMLTFEIGNGAINRMALRGTLGRPRATQIDNIVDRLMRGVDLPTGESPEGLRQFLWNRLAIESMRGTDLSPLANRENIQNWQANFRQAQVEVQNTANQAPQPQANSRPQNLISRLFNQAVQGSSSRTQIQLSRRSSPLEVDSGNPQTLANNVAAQMIAQGLTTPPDQNFYVDAEGNLYHPPTIEGAQPSAQEAHTWFAVNNNLYTTREAAQRAAGSNASVSEVSVRAIRFSFVRSPNQPQVTTSTTRPQRGRGQDHVDAVLQNLVQQGLAENYLLHLSPETQSTIQNHVTNETNRQTLLASHGEAVQISGFARVYGRLIREAMTHRSQQEFSLVITPENSSLQALYRPLATVDGYSIYNLAIEQIPTAVPMENGRSINLQNEVICDIRIPTENVRLATESTNTQANRRPILRNRQVNSDGTVRELPEALRALFEDHRQSTATQVFFTLSSGDTRVHINPLGVHSGDTGVTFTQSNFSSSDPAHGLWPADLRVNVSQDTQGNWWVSNQSRNTTIKVGNRTLRPAQRTSISDNQATIEVGSGNSLLQFTVNVGSRPTQAEPGPRTAANPTVNPGNTNALRVEGSAQANPAPQTPAQTNPTSQRVEYRLLVEGENTFIIIGDRRIPFPKDSNIEAAVRQAIGNPQAQVVLAPRPGSSTRNASEPIATSSREEAPANNGSFDQSGVENDATSEVNPDDVESLLEGSEVVDDNSPTNPRIPALGAATNTLPTHVTLDGISYSVEVTRPNEAAVGTRHVYHLVQETAQPNPRRIQLVTSRELTPAEFTNFINDGNQIPSDLTLFSVTSSGPIGDIPVGEAASRRPVSFYLHEHTGATGLASQNELAVVIGTGVPQPIQDAVVTLQPEANGSYRITAHQGGLIRVSQHNLVSGPDIGGTLLNATEHQTLHAGQGFSIGRYSFTIAENGTLLRHSGQTEAQMSIEVNLAQPQPSPSPQGGGNGGGNGGRQSSNPPPQLSGNTGASQNPPVEAAAAAPHSENNSAVNQTRTRRLTLQMTLLQRGDNNELQLNEHQQTLPEEGARELNIDLEPGSAPNTWEAIIGRSHFAQTEPSRNGLRSPLTINNIWQDVSRQLLRIRVDANNQISFEPIASTSSSLGREFLHRNFETVTVRRGNSSFQFSQARELMTLPHLETDSHTSSVLITTSDRNIHLQAVRLSNPAAAHVQASQPVLGSIFDHVDESGTHAQLQITASAPLSVRSDPMRTGLINFFIPLKTRVNRFLEGLRNFLASLFRPRRTEGTTAQLPPVIQPAVETRAPVIVAEPSNTNPIPTLQMPGGVRPVQINPGESIVIGRRAESGIQISFPAISGRHAEISCRIENGETHHYLRDLGSSNGTRIRRGEEVIDVRAVGETELRNGDRILLGPTEMVWQL